MGGLSAALEGAALADLSGWPRLLAKGPEFLDLLHRLSTGDVKTLRPGEGRPTVITTPKGRILARVIVLHLGEDGVLVLGGPDTGDRVVAHLTKYAMGAVTGLSDVTASTRAFAIVGPKAETAGLPDLPPFGVVTDTLGGRSVRVARTNGFDADGWMVVAAEGDADAARSALASRVESLADAELEAWRILTRRPRAGRELTEEYNPLEAGLRDAVSFTKGCYVGQEVVARLNTYDKVSRGIVALAFDGPAPPAGARVLLGGREVGTLTSAVVDPRTGEIAALAYVKRRDVPEGTGRLEIAWDGGRSVARLVNR